MCGIAGIIGSPNKITIESLCAMTNILTHRGPDGDGHWINATKQVGLGHRRLAIIDLSNAGKQPMHFRNNRYTIIYNGEIYNYIEIKEDLIRQGYQFQTTCDTEVLLALYDTKKENCLSDLDGMFSFAIWDEKEQRLFCGRDRFGEKPFYFALHDGALYFASEMKALWAVGIPKVTNNQMLFNYMAYGFVYNPENLAETFYENIYKLKAAHYFFVTPDNLQPVPKRYWDINYQTVDENISESAATEKFRHLFYESVKRRLRSDVPVGSSLSGGLDSSLVVCVIDELRKNSPNPQLTFSARFPDFAKDEGKYMRMVIDKTNVDPHFVHPDDEGLINDFDTLCYHLEEPFGGASVYAQFCVMRLAKENNVTVLLDGQGADELLGGYHFYFPDYFRELKSKDKLLRKNEIRAFQRIHSNSVVQFNRRQEIKDAIVSGLPEFLHTKAIQIKYKQKASNIFDKDFFAEYFKSSFIFNAKPAHTLAESLHRSALGGSMETLLHFADRNSMAHSREVRLPFLSHELAEFVFNLPAHYKIRDGITKFIMRKSFMDLLPEGIYNRQDKIGYEPPQANWLKNQKIQAQLSDFQSRLQKEKILNPKFSLSNGGQNTNQDLAWKTLTVGLFTRR